MMKEGTDPEQSENVPESGEPVTIEETTAAAPPAEDTEQPVNRNEVLTQVSAKFVSDVSSVWGRV